MPQIEPATINITGMYHDVLSAPGGRVLWDSGWRKNTIVVDCRRLLATFMRGGNGTSPAPLGSPAVGIQGLQVGAGLDAWDRPPGLPVPDDTRTALVDTNYYTVPFDPSLNPPIFKIDFLDGGNIATTPTNRLQIAVTLGPGIPPWANDGHHNSVTLREFGLVGEIGKSPVLINYVAHTAIVKDPASTLNRTIWLVF